MSSSSLHDRRPARRGRGRVRLSPFARRSAATRLAFQRPGPRQTSGAGDRDSPASRSTSVSCSKPSGVGGTFNRQLRVAARRTGSRDPPTGRPFARGHLQPGGRTSRTESRCPLQPAARPTLADRHAEARRVTAGPVAPGNVTIDGSTVDQFGSPAIPFSFPHHRTSGPASENITASG